MHHPIIVPPYIQLTLRFNFNDSSNLSSIQPVIWQVDPDPFKSCMAIMQACQLSFSSTHRTSILSVSFFSTVNLGVSVVIPPNMDAISAKLRG